MGAMQMKCIPTEWHGEPSFFHPHAIVAVRICSQRSTETQDWISQLCPRLKESRTNQVIGSVAVLEALAIISVVLRAISKRIGHVKYGWDDYLIFAAWYERPCSKRVT